MAEIEGARQVGGSAIQRNFVDSIGAFFLLNKKGQLVALRSLTISDDCSVFTPQALHTDLTAMYPLVENIKASSITLCVSYGERASAHYLMQVNMGGSKQTLKAPGKTLDILNSSLENDNFPVIAQTDLERAVLASRQSGEPLMIPIRMLILRASVPQELAARIKDLFVQNAAESGTKDALLGASFKDLRTAIRETLLYDFLAKCMWLDTDSGRLGNMVKEGTDLNFQPLDSDDRELSAFLVALEKDPYGDYLLDFREFARIIPKISKNTPWVGPTLHVYNEAYRRECGLEEHYSLYAGFRALTQHGTPVVLLEGQNPLSEPSEVRYVQISQRSVNVLQGRILDGDVLKEGVRDFTSRDLVWKT